jgi:hypothetical protein
MNDQESVFVAMRRQIAATPIPTPQPLPRRPRAASRARIAVCGAGASVAAVVVVLVTGVFASTPAAFAITTTSSGTTIELTDFSALDALNTKLAADGTPLQVVPAVAGCTATARLVDPTGAVEPPQTLEAHHTSGPIGSIGIGHLGEPPPGDTFIVGISSDSHWLMLLPREIQGAVPNCVGESPPRPSSHT